MATLEEKVIELSELEKQVLEARDAYEKVLCQFKLKENALVQCCPHDAFWAEDDDDYHSSGYYYVCKTCRYLTKIKPRTKKIDYVIN
jgi:hypothetical protein